MSRHCKTLFGCLVAVVVAISAGAQTTGDSAVAVIRPVLSVFSAEIGSANLRDTYLTPLTYDGGWQAAIGYERMQAMRFNPERWIMQLDGRLALGRSLNPSRSALMWLIDFRPAWSMMWRKGFAYGFTLAAGGTAELDLGVLYLPRNGNNPASVKASLTLGATGMAVWNGQIGPLRLTARYQPRLPLTGVFFSPDYDELYYEIWLGNHSRLAHFAWPGNFFRLDNLLTADLHLGATTLRLGYRCEIFSSKAAGITNRAVTHTFVIGVASELVALRAGAKRSEEARIISALY